MTTKQHRNVNKRNETPVKKPYSESDCLNTHSYIFHWVKRLGEFDFVVLLFPLGVAKVARQLYTIWRKKEWYIPKTLLLVDNLSWKSFGGSEKKPFHYAGISAFQI